MFFLLQSYSRQVEFGRAILEKLLKANSPQPKLSYFGVVRVDQGDVLKAFEERIYKFWDVSSDAPPQARERTPQEQPTCQVLRWAGAVPRLPTNIFTQFPEGTPHHAAIVKLEEELRSFWPDPSGASTSIPPSPGPTPTPRVATGPDLTGASFVDVGRRVSLPSVAVAGFNVPRLASQGQVDIMSS